MAEEKAVPSYTTGSKLQLTAHNNKKQPGEPVFILPDGKLGFPSRDSIPVEVGDVISGEVAMVGDSYVFITANKTLYKNGEPV